MFSATLQGLKQEDYEFYGMRNPVKISLKAMEKVEEKKEKLISHEKKAYVIPKSLNNIFIKMSNRL